MGKPTLLLYCAQIMLIGSLWHPSMLSLIFYQIITTSKTVLAVDPPSRDPHNAVYSQKRTLIICPCAGGWSLWGFSILTFECGTYPYALAQLETVPTASKPVWSRCSHISFGRAGCILDSTLWLVHYGTWISTFVLALYFKQNR